MAKESSDIALLMNAVTEEPAYWFRSVFQTVGLVSYVNLNHLCIMASVLDGFSKSPCMLTSGQTSSIQ